MVFRVAEEVGIKTVKALASKDCSKLRLRGSKQLPQQVQTASVYCERPTWHHRVVFLRERWRISTWLGSTLLAEQAGPAREAQGWITVSPSMTTILPVVGLAAVPSQAFQAVELPRSDVA
jgi:hypothetical protein